MQDGWAAPLVIACCRLLVWASQWACRQLCICGARIPLCCRYTLVLPRLHYIYHIYTSHILPTRLPCPPGCLQVGHNALGAGQIVDQGAKCVDAALASGEH